MYIPAYFVTTFDHCFLLCAPESRERPFLYYTLTRQSRRRNYRSPRGSRFRAGSPTCNLQTDRLPNTLSIACTLLQFALLVPRLEQPTKMSQNDYLY